MSEFSGEGENRAIKTYKIGASLGGYNQTHDFKITFNNYNVYSSSIMAGDFINYDYYVDAKTADATKVGGHYSVCIIFEKEIEGKKQYCRIANTGEN